MADSTGLIPAERIQSYILLVRNQKVIFDWDLAALYGVETRVLVQTVQRNRNRFPGDFMFQLTKEEFDNLRSQFVISSGRGGRRYPPYAFTEHRVAVLSTVLRSERAVQVNIEIMRAFVRLREMLASNQDLNRRLDDLERRYDSQFKAVFDAIRELMAPPVPTRKRLGFRVDEA